LSHRRAEARTGFTGFALDPHRITPSNDPVPPDRHTVGGPPLVLVARPPHAEKHVRRHDPSHRLTRPPLSKAERGLSVRNDKRAAKPRIDQRAGDRGLIWIGPPPECSSTSSARGGAQRSWGPNRRGRHTPLEDQRAVVVHMVFSATWSRSTAAQPVKGVHPAARIRSVGFRPRPRTPAKPRPPSMSANYDVRLLLPAAPGSYNRPTVWGKDDLGDRLRCRADLVAESDDAFGRLRPKCLSPNRRWDPFFSPMMIRTGEEVYWGYPRPSISTCHAHNSPVARDRLTQPRVPGWFTDLGRLCADLMSVQSRTCVEGGLAVGWYRAWGERCADRAG